MASTINIGYSPNDFFWINAKDQKYMPADTECDRLMSLTDWETKCDAHNFESNSDDCINKELCNNKDYATKIVNNENKNNGTDKKYTDSKQRYDVALMDMINLGIGICFTVYIIYRNRNIVG